MDCWYTSLDVDNEFEKLLFRMNPPRVSVDNSSNPTATLVKVDSANKHGSLLEVVQALTDLNLTINRAYISSDGEWFMDVFHVVDQFGNKLSDGEVIQHIEEALGPKSRSFRSLRRSVGVQAATEHTSIELTGRDRPGLLSEIFAVLADLKCNVVAAEVWTHNSRMASVVYITDEETGTPIDNPDCLAKIKQLLLYVLKGDRDKRSASTVVSMGGTHRERRLHQMMYADRDYDKDDDEPTTTYDQSKPLVTVENCADKGYTVVNLRCRDRPKLLFDTVCTLTDMQYVVFHSTVIAEGAEAYQVFFNQYIGGMTAECGLVSWGNHIRKAFLGGPNIYCMTAQFGPKINGQEYYIRHKDGCPVNSEAERQRLIHCLEAAIRRRTSEGIRLELCGDDRVGLLSDVTRIFRENGLSVTRAEVTTRGSQAVNVFYVTDASGYQVKSETIEAVRSKIGQTILHVKDDVYSKSPPQESARFSLGTLFRTRSEKFLYNLGLIKSCS